MKTTRKKPSRFQGGGNQPASIVSNPDTEPVQKGKIFCYKCDTKRDKAYVPCGFPARTGVCDVCIKEMYAEMWNPNNQGKPPLGTYMTRIGGTCFSCNKPKEAAEMIKLNMTAFEGICMDCIKVAYNALFPNQPYYLDEKPKGLSIKEKAAKLNEYNPGPPFVWNEHGVCTNPYEIIVYSDAKFYCEISYAFDDDTNLWYHAYHFDYRGSMTGCTSGGSGVWSPRHGDKIGSYKGYKFEQEAIIQALKDNLPNFKKNHPSGTSSAKVLKAIQYLISMYQVELDQVKAAARTEKKKATAKSRKNKASRKEYLWSDDKFDRGSVCQNPDLFVLYQGKTVVAKILVAYHKESKAWEYQAYYEIGNCSNAVPFEVMHYRNTLGVRDLNAAIHEAATHCLENIVFQATNKQPGHNPEELEECKSLIDDLLTSEFIDIEDAHNLVYSFNDACLETKGAVELFNSPEAEVADPPQAEPTTEALADIVPGLYRCTFSYSRFGGPYFKKKTEIEVTEVWTEQGICICKHENAIVHIAIEQIREHWKFISSTMPAVQSIETTPAEPTMPTTNPFSLGLPWEFLEEAFGEGQNPLTSYVFPEPVPDVVALPADKAIEPMFPAPSEPVDYPGSKNIAGVPQRLINQVTPHDVFVSGCLGKCALMATKKPARTNYGIDVNMEVLRPYWDSLKRKDIQLVRDDFFKWIAQFNFSGVMAERWFIYLDPPYLKSACLSQVPLFKYEFTDEQHAQLIRWALDTTAFSKNTHIAINHPPCKEYDALLSHGWRKMEYEVTRHRGVVVLDALYMNYPEPEALHEYTYLGGDKIKRQAVKRKVQGYVEKFRNMEVLERNAILAEIEAQFKASTPPIRDRRKIN